MAKRLQASDSYVAYMQLGRIPRGLTLWTPNTDIPLADGETGPNGETGLISAAPLHVQLQYGELYCRYDIEGEACNVAFKDSGALRHHIMKKHKDLVVDKVGKTGNPSEEKITEARKWYRKVMEKHDSLKPIETPPQPVQSGNLNAFRELTPPIPPRKSTRSAAKSSGKITKPKELKGKAKSKSTGSQRIQKRTGSKKGRYATKIVKVPVPCHKRANKKLGVGKNDIDVGACIQHIASNYGRDATCYACSGIEDGTCLFNAACENLPRYFTGFQYDNPQPGQGSVDEPVEVEDDEDDKDAESDEDDAI